ncbi:Protein phosphatase 2C-like protein [Smittium mucronatum]|uniref:Protein phosphatase 2C-like protein n=1 Tax=Smittium mucronatum TaxID=133383 RepID=A0A1R0GXZ5_9FUNG|nr:Protein phosphatase 2C-like protein [Smittium mucronatum]
MPSVVKRFISKGSEDKFAPSTQDSDSNGQNSYKKTNDDISPKKNNSFSKFLIIAGLGVSILGYLYINNYAPTKPENSTPIDFQPEISVLVQSNLRSHLEEVKELRDQAMKFINEKLESGFSLKKAIKSLDPLSSLHVSSIFKEKENHSVLYNVSNPSQKLKLDIYSNQISSNNPIEDYMVWKDLVNTENGDFINKQFFGVFDGHAGYMCAEKISGLFPSLFDKTYTLADSLINQSSTKKDSEILDLRIKKKLNIYSSNDLKILKENENAIALSSAFEIMDEIVVVDSVKTYLNLKDDEKSLEKFNSLLGPAVSGSCGIAMIVDQNDLTLTVANTGDSRAVLGSKLKTGNWKSIELSHDQTADNESELKRITSEHPGEENSVIMRGRVLGGLMPLRAFGDSRYKWKMEYQNMLFPSLLANGHKYATTPRKYLTPPYVTAKPIIVKHKITKDSDKFVVMATDGLWDRLSNEQVVNFIGKWIDSNGPITDNNNPSSSLIEYALGFNYQGSFDKSRPSHLLAIPPPFSRRYRDDISVYVVVLDQS